VDVVHKAREADPPPRASELGPDHHRLGCLFWVEPVRYSRRGEDHDERGLACNAWVEKYRAKDWQQRGKRWSDGYSAEVFNKCNDGKPPFEDLESLKRETQ
jgi:hypothetical protein